MFGNKTGFFLQTTITSLSPCLSYLKRAYIYKNEERLENLALEILLTLLAQENSP